MRSEFRVCVSIAIAIAFLLPVIPATFRPAAAEDYDNVYMTRLPSEDIADTGEILQERATDAEGQSELVFNAHLVSITRTGNLDDESGFYTLHLQTYVAGNTLGRLGYNVVPGKTIDESHIYFPTTNVTDLRSYLLNDGGYAMRFPKWYDWVSEKYIQFTFPYYGHFYDSIYINENGYVCLGQTTNMSSPSPQFIFPDTRTDRPNGVIAPFWRDLDANSVASGGTIECGLSGTTGYYPYVFSVSWWGVKNKATGSYQYFNLALRGNGTIEFVYASITYPEYYGPHGSLTVTTGAGIEDIPALHGTAVESPNIVDSTRV
ncbi:MAG TPA: hypothetical protein VGB78_11150, partial [Thermoplasmata archaeon]